MAELKLYNSLTRKKQVFDPIDASHVRIYACGPTVYSYAHIGNARMAVVFDVLSRLLRGIYPKVTYVSNITDIDDKIIKASQDNGEAIDVITKKYAKIYNEDMASLGVAPPDIQPLATDHIAGMIDIIETLIAKDHAYMADGHVLFHVPSFAKYGGLSGRSRDEQVAGARVEIASYKRDPVDFVLWKPSSDDEPAWDSPWSRGRPGWHIECSAMAAQHLGLPFDIHGGGADLKFPHHENEIAQSCCAHGNKEDLASFSKYWVHNGFVTVDGEKMSKSLGNVVLAHDLAKGHKGETLRMALLSAHYRQPLDWTDKKIHQSKKQLDRFYQRLEQMKDIEPVKISSSKIFNALCDDLNTPLAIANMNNLLKEENSPSLKAELIAAGDMLGILQHNSEEWLDCKALGDGTCTDYIDNLLRQRDQARANKDFARSDEIRDELSSMGIAIEDTPNGVIWKKIH